jgi:hypothetical protein
MTPMNAAKLKGLIAKYRDNTCAAAVAVTASLGRKPSRRRAGRQVKTPIQQWSELAPRPTIEELNAQRTVIEAEIDRLYGVVDNVYPKEMFERFCKATEKLSKQAQGLLIELLANGADGPGVQATAAMLCEYNDAISDMKAFHEERKAKTSFSWAPLATLAGIGSLLMMNYLGNRKKPA